MKIAHLSQNIQLSLVNSLDSWLGINGYKSSVFYNNANTGKKPNYFFLKPQSTISAVLKKIYYTYTSPGIANFSFFKQAIPNSELIKIINKYDIVHIHWVNYFLSMSNLNNLTSSLPVVITVHDYQLLFGGCHFTEGCKNYLKNCIDCPQLKKELQAIAEKNFLIKKKILNCDNISFVHQNPTSVDYGKKIFPLANHSLISCTINTNIFKPIFNIDEIKKKYKITNNEKVILCSANYNCNTKGVDLLPKLIAGLNDDIKLIMIGNGFDHLKIKNNKILHIGYIDNPIIINELYNISDIVFSTSTEETGPGTACESLSSGTSFVGFAGVGNLNKMIKNDFNGFLVLENSLDQLIYILNNKKFITNKENIRNDYIKNFDVNFYSKYSSIYKSAYSNFRKKSKINEFEFIYDDFLIEDLSFQSFLQYFKKKFVQFTHLLMSSKNFKKIWNKAIPLKFKFFLKNKYLNLFK